MSSTLLVGNDDIVPTKFVASSVAMTRRRPPEKVVVIEEDGSWIGDAAAGLFRVYCELRRLEMGKK